MQVSALINCIPWKRFMVQTPLWSLELIIFKKSSAQYHSIFKHRSKFQYWICHRQPNHINWQTLCSLFFKSQQQINVGNPSSHYRHIKIGHNVKFWVYDYKNKTVVLKSSLRKVHEIFIKSEKWLLIILSQNVQPYRSD